MIHLIVSHIHALERDERIVHYKEELLMLSERTRPGAFISEVTLQY